MAVNKDDLLIMIEVNAKEAQKAIADLTVKIEGLSEAQRKQADAQKGFVTGVEKIRDQMGLLAAAYFGILKPLQNVTTEYMQAHDALTQLGNTLRFTGDNVSQTVTDFDDFSKSLERATGADGDLLISLLKTAKTMGLSNEAAKKFVNTAVNMASATGKDVAQSFDALRMSTFGNVRALGELRGLVSEFTPEQLKAGAAVDKLSVALDGFAEKSAPTFYEEGQKVTHAIGELSENIGNVILKIFNLDKPTSSFSDFLYQAADLVKDLTESLVVMGRVLLAPFNLIISIAFKATYAITTIGAAINDAIVAAAKFGDVINKLSGKPVVNDTVIDSFKERADSLWAISEAANEASKQSLDAIFGKNETIKSANKELEKTSATIKTIPPDFEEVQKAIEDLLKKTEELRKASQLAGKSEIETARLKAVEDLKELGLLEQKVKGNKAALQAANEARSAVVAGFAASQAAMIQKELDNIQRQNEQIQNQNETFGLNTQDRLRKELDLQIELIEAQREKLILEGKYSDEIESTLTRQKALLKQRMEQRLSVESSPTEKAMQSLGNIGAEFKTMFGSAFSDSVSSLSGVLGNAFKGLGTNISDKISGVLGENLTGIMSQVGGFVGQFASSTMSLISNIVTLIIQLPAIISSVSDMLKGLLKFPADLVNSLSGLFSTILEVLTVSFVKTLGELPGKLVNMLTAFIPKLANALIPIIAELPNIIIKFADSFPLIVEKFIYTLTANAPRIVKSLIDALIKKGPALIASLARLAPKLGFAIAKGIWEALYDTITSGKFPSFDLELDTDGIADTFKKIGESLTGDTSRLFNVSDLTEAVVGPSERLSALADNVKKAFKDGTDLLTKAWQWFEKNILMPLGKFVSDAFQWVVDNILDPLAGVVETAFQWVVDNILNPLSGIVQKAFQWVVDKVVTPLIDFITNLGTNLQAAFTTLLTLGTQIGDAVVSAITGAIETLKDKFKELGTAIKDGLSDALGGLEDKFKELGEALAGPLKSISGGGGGGGGGFLGQVSSAFGFSEGGIIPGNAKVFGDSIHNDVVPAMLSPGEAVIPRSAMQDPAIAETVKSILQGRNVPRFADGLMPRLTAQPGDTSINLGGVVINTTQSVDADFVRAKLMPTIQKELRRASLDGQAVIYKAGIR